MKSTSHTDASGPAGQPGRSLWVVGAAFLVILLVAILLPRRNLPRKREPESNGTAQAATRGFSAATEPRWSARHSPGAVGVASPTAEEIVAARLKRFAQSRREIVHAIARKTGKPVPPEVEKFFDALESGNWDEIKSQFHQLALHSSQYSYSKDHQRELDPFWEAVLDAYGPAEQAHLFPAQKFLDYGNAALDALRPGMVYVGGTDPGRFIVSMMNDTSDGEHHVVLTQNAFADSRYLDYLTFLYGDQLSRR
jgi:hypothetical protein